MSSQPCPTTDHLIKLPFEGPPISPNCSKYSWLFFSQFQSTIQWNSKSRISQFLYYLQTNFFALKKKKRRGRRSNLPHPDKLQPGACLDLHRVLWKSRLPGHGWAEEEHKLGFFSMQHFGFCHFWRSASAQTMFLLLLELLPWWYS